MTNATALSQVRAARILAVGYPGSGKTGALVPLVNTGFKLRVLAFDKVENMAPLFAFVKPEFLGNIDIIPLEDDFRGGAGKPTEASVEFAGPPTAFMRGLQAMDHWVSKDPTTGVETDLGRSRDWGPDTIVVLDSATANGFAAHSRILALGNRTRATGRDTDFNAAMNEQEAFINRLTSGNNRFHLYVTAHLKIIGPKEIRHGKGGDDEITTKIKEAAADLIPTRLYPTFLGREFPQKVGQYFPTILLFDKETKGTKVQRVIRTAPREEFDTKLPALNVPPVLDAETGLLTVFKALVGYNTAPVVATTQQPTEKT